METETETQVKQLTALAGPLRIAADVVLRACREAYAGEPEFAALVRQHHGYCNARRATTTTIAAEVGLDAGTIFRVWTGQARNGDVEAYERAASPFLKKLGKSNRLTHADTTAAQLVWEALDVALRRSARGKGVMVFVQGDAGCGKTTVSRAWAQVHNHGLSCFYEPLGAGGVKTMLREIGELRGLDPESGYDRLLRRLFRCFEPGIVLIVDEAHLLVSEQSGSKQAKLDVLRRISDISRCAVVLLGTDNNVEDVLARSDYNDRQLWRRMGRIVQLPKLAKDSDIRALFEFSQPIMEFDDSILVVLRAINEHEKGGFGQIGILLDDAADYAQESGRHTPTRKDLLVCAEKKLVALDAIKSRTRKR